MARAHAAAGIAQFDKQVAAGRDRSRRGSARPAPKWGTPAGPRPRVSGRDGPEGTLLRSRRSRATTRRSAAALPAISAPRSSGRPHPALPSRTRPSGRRVHSRGLRYTLQRHACWRQSVACRAVMRQCLPGGRPPGHTKVKLATTLPEPARTRALQSQPSVPVPGAPASSRAPGPLQFHGSLGCQASLWRLARRGDYLRGSGRALRG